MSVKCIKKKLKRKIFKKKSVYLKHFEIKKITLNNSY